MRQMTTAGTVRDGETLALSFFNDDTLTTLPNGTTVHKPFTGPKKKHLIVFITATIIDRAGNRVHPAPPQDKKNR